MSTTTSDYLAISQNLSRYQTMTAADPSVKGATGYYQENITKVASIADFVGNYRLLSYALEAHGLGNFVNSKALVTKVLEGGVSNPHSLAHTLNDARWLSFARAFDFVGQGASSISTSDAVSATTGQFVEAQLESDQGAENVGVQLALYFQRVAPNVTSSYGIMADKNLLQVVQTIFGLPPAAGSNIDAEATAIDKLVPVSDLQDPKKVRQLTERFTAMYDATYGVGSTAAAPLTATSNKAGGTVSAAESILSSVLSSNSSMISSILGPVSGFSNALMASLQSFRLGG